MLLCAPTAGHTGHPPPTSGGSLTGGWCRANHLTPSPGTCYTPTLTTGPLSHHTPQLANIGTDKAQGILSHLFDLENLLHHDGVAFMPNFQRIHFLFSKLPHISNHLLMESIPSPSVSLLLSPISFINPHIILLPYFRG